MKEVMRWLRSFRYAYEGIKYALATQRNMKFHFFVSFVALDIGFVFSYFQNRNFIYYFSHYISYYDRTY